MSFWNIFFWNISWDTSLVHGNFIYELLGHYLSPWKFSSTFRAFSWSLRIFYELLGHLCASRTCVSSQGIFEKFPEHELLLDMNFVFANLSELLRHAFGLGEFFSAFRTSSPSF